MIDETITIETKEQYYELLKFVMTSGSMYLNTNDNTGIYVTNELSPEQRKDILDAEFDELYKQLSGMTDQ